MSTYQRFALAFLFSVSPFFTFVANAQRLNSEGLKMVSKVTINSLFYDKVIDFSYDENDKLQEVVYTLVKRNYKPYRTYKEVITKRDGKITQKSYFNGNPNDHYESAEDNYFTYEYCLNNDGKICKFHINAHTWARTIARINVELVYKDGVLDELKRTHSYKENAPYFHFDPNISCIKFYYTHQGYYTQRIDYNLTDEQHRKYAPELTEDELKECENNGMKRYELKKPNYKMYEYSPNIKNDTNIGFNGLHLMLDMGVSSGGDALDNILYYTEWVGLRERNMLLNYDDKKEALIYRYDSKGNIIKMIYRHGEKMRNRRVDMDEDLMTISIEYVAP